MATYASPLHQFDRQLPLGDFHYTDHLDFLDIYSEQHHHQPHPQLMVDSNNMAPYEGQGELDFSQEAFVGDDHDFFAKQSAHVQQFHQLQQHQHHQHQHQHHQHQHPQPPSLTAADRFVNAYGVNSSSNSAASIGSSTSSAHGSPTVHPDFAQASLQTHSIWDHNLPTGLESNDLNVENIDFDELFPDSKLNGISFVGESTGFPSSSSTAVAATAVAATAAAASASAPATAPKAQSPLQSTTPLATSFVSSTSHERESSRRGSSATASSATGPPTPSSLPPAASSGSQPKTPFVPVHGLPSPASPVPTASLSYPVYTHGGFPASSSLHQGWPGSHPFSRNITSSPRPYILGSPSLTASPKSAMSEFQNIPRSSPKARERQYFHTTSGHFVPPLGYSYPSLIQPVVTPHSLTPPILSHQTPAPPSNIIPFPQPHPHPVSPVGSSNSQRSSGNQYKSPRISFQNPGWAPYQTTRRPSSFSNVSRFSSESPSSEGHGDESREKERCPFPDCGRTFKDLKAHMLTHQNERPEKCPIASCEYHHKGFARKYDKNRHTLTHYKGTMVCGFCPGSGSASEKSFNRADVFKRHLTSVHNVEQNPPNSRKKASTSAEDKSSPQSKDATGKCSTCGGFFKNAQAFYEHLDDCVLRIVQQEDPSEAINEKLLSSVSDDPEVQRTLDRHNLHNLSASGFPAGDEDDEEEAEEEGPLNQEGAPSGGAAASRSGRGGIKSRKDDVQGNSWGPLSASAGTNVSKAGPGQTSGSRGNARCGVTFSKGGVALVGKSRKRRKNYPLSWGASADKVKMKKRVICCFDGPRRLVKDDMMLGTEFEVRMPLPGEEGRYITDLDMETLRRSEAFHASTEEERGEWYPDNVRMSANARIASTPVLPPATP